MEKTISSRPNSKTPRRKTKKMIARTAFISLMMGTTALASASAQDAQTISTTPNVVQSTLLQEAVEPKLNVGLAHSGFKATPGEALTFVTYWNYDGFIDRGEVLIYNARDADMAEFPSGQYCPTQYQLASARAARCSD